MFPKSWAVTAHLAKAALDGLPKPLQLSHQSMCVQQAEVRDLAAAAQLPNRERPDSQGICFLGQVRFSEFVKAHLGTWPGLLIEEETNEIVGVHEGMWFYTPGQRKGIMLSGGPW